MLEPDGIQTVHDIEIVREYLNGHIILADTAYHGIETGELAVKAVFSEHKPGLPREERQRQLNISADRMIYSISVSSLYCVPFFVLRAVFGVMCPPVALVWCLGVPMSAVPIHIPLGGHAQGVDWPVKTAGSTKRVSHGQQNPQGERRLDHFPLLPFLLKTLRRLSSDKERLLKDISLERSGSFPIISDGIQFFANCFAQPWRVEHREDLLRELELAVPSLLRLVRAEPVVFSHIVGLCYNASVTDLDHRECTPPPPLRDLIFEATRSAVRKRVVPSSHVLFFFSALGSFVRDPAFVPRLHAIVSEASSTSGERM
ncbi:hypothetical protein ADUPG1_008862 [Aduncisulcus paluster]|uniref:Uncharacterized protein n=1 Tax=Aduncisulcus paluster TaxID=2918883 RepID=A0ABQ5KTI3_9EUKA|nr:hypothetical protein ADUPG1_008862 [Aduncisulcus paluster]